MEKMYWIKELFTCHFKVSKSYQDIIFDDGSADTTGVMASTSTIRQAAVQQLKIVPTIQTL